MAINVIHEIHSNREQKPTTHPGTKVAMYSYLEKYIEIQKAIEARSIGKGTTLLSSEILLTFVEVSSLHPPDPLGIGNSSGHADKHFP